MSEIKEEFGDSFIPDISDCNMEKEIEVKNQPLEDNGRHLGQKTENYEVGNNNKLDNEINQVSNKDNYIQELENKEEIENFLGDVKMKHSYIENIKHAIDLVAIDSVAKPGTFACGGVLEKAKLELSVKGVGNIHLPLSSDQGEILKNKCTAAPFGRGSETLVHKSVRDAWQIDAKDVTLDPEFNNLIKEKIEEIIPTLMGEPFSGSNMCSLVESELYKLVYYEKGGHFLAHRDTEKSPGMFATLVIQLPAVHRGGGLVVWHKEETKVFEFDNDSNDKFFFTAFFADCEHELRRVSSGHRIVLIYNLIRKSTHLTLHPKNDYNPCKNNKFLTTMAKAVEEWKLDTKGPAYLALKFDYLYTKANMSFHNLKGKDKIITDALCSFADIEVFLTTLTKTEKRTGYDDHDTGSLSQLIPSEDEEEQEECSYTLTNWMGVNDSLKYFGELSFSKNEMLDLLVEEDMFPKGERSFNNKDMQLFKDLLEDDKYKSEFSYKARYWGNEGCNIEFFYKKTVVVFFPKTHKILISCENNLNKNLANCKKLTNNNLEDAFEYFQGILLFIEKRHEKAMIQLQEGDNVACILEILLLFENKLEMIKSQTNKLLVALAKPYESKKYYYSRNEKKLGIPTIKSAFALGKLIKKVGWESLSSSVLLLVKECAITHTITCAQLVSCMLSHGLHDQAISVVEIVVSQFSTKSNTLSSNCWALWAVLLASHDTFSFCFDAIIQQISKLESNVMIKIISEMYGSLQPNILNQCKTINSFLNILNILKYSGWKNLSVESATLVWPLILFVDKSNLNASPILSLVQTVIEHKDSSLYLSELLKLGINVEEKDNPSFQLMVKKRLEQLNNVTQPVFSWAQPNATLEERATYYRGQNSGPEKDNIQNFLRGNQQSMSFGGFEGKIHASQFGNKYFRDGSYDKFGKYSARHEIKGGGKKVMCTIIKTRDLFEIKNNEYIFICTEADVLKKKFCEPKKTVAQKRPLE